MTYPDELHSEALFDQPQIGDARRSPFDIAGDLPGSLRALGGRDRSHVEASFESEAMPEVAFDVADLEIREPLNQPYDIRIRLQTEQTDIEPALLLGTNCAVRLERGEQEQRFAGLVGEVLEGTTEPRHLTIKLRIVPALWMLGLRRDTRIFQDKTVPEILEEVLWLGLGDLDRTFRLDLTRAYPTCEYRLQYDESDLDFVNRLMEEEGITYWFDHDTDERETIVLADDLDQYQEIDHPEGRVAQMSSYAAGGDNRETIRELHRRSVIRPTAQTTRHWEWTHASAIEAEEEGRPPAEGEVPHGAASGPVREEYDHDLRPLTFSDYNDGQRCYQANDSGEQARLRRELQARDARVGHGTGSFVAFRAGRTFELNGHSQPELDGDYLLTEVTHRFDASTEEDEDRYTNRFVCLPAGVPFRPDRRTARPRIQGIQTATVVGPLGEEIHTDEHGRIKVQFHWDRQGVMDEHSSCWLRVMQPWAGEGWGFVFLPRIGMEVTVTFLDGDPDRPLVTGAVYNGDHVPPYPLPDDKTRSVIRTRSTLDGGPEDYNELSFEDQAGEEEVYLQAQRDLRELVKHNHGTTVRGDQTNSVSGNQNESVGLDQTMSVDGNRTVNIGGSQAVTIDGGGSNGGVTGSSLTITGDYRVDVSQTVYVTAPDHIKLQVGSSYLMIEPDRIILHSGGASLTLEEAMAILISNQRSHIRLTENAMILSRDNSYVSLSDSASMWSSDESRVQLDAEVNICSSGDSQLQLNAEAMMQSSRSSFVTLAQNAMLQSSDGGTVMLADIAVLQSGDGSSRVNANSGGVVVSGPEVRLNP